jgi:hypothetical protein
VAIGNDVNDFFTSGVKVPAAFDKNTPVGTTVMGIITDAVKRQKTDPKDGSPKTFPDGNPQMQVVITIKTTLRDPADPDDEGLRRLYASGSMQKAIGQALVKAKAPGLEQGGVIAVKFTGLGVASGPAMNPPKLYSATYQPPKNAPLVVDDAPPAQQQAAQTSPAATSPDELQGEAKAAFDAMMKEMGQ